MPYICLRCSLKVIIDKNDFPVETTVWSNSNALHCLLVGRFTQISDRQLKLTVYITISIHMRSIMVGILWSEAG